MVSTSPTPLGDGAVAKPEMYPSAFSTSASATFCFDEGITTWSCIAVFALRTRVSMSAMGSVIMMDRSPFSPRALGQARDLAGMGELSQADPAEAELAVHGTRTAAAAAAGVGANLELGSSVRLVDECLLGHVSLFSLRDGRAAGSLALLAVQRALAPLLARSVLGVSALLEGEAERIEERVAGLVVVGRGDDGDVHATLFVDLVG